MCLVGRLGDPMCYRSQSENWSCFVNHPNSNLFCKLVQELPLKRVFAGAQYPDDEQLESFAGGDFFGPVNFYLIKI